jgi:hypothetical protein
MTTYTSERALLELTFLSAEQSDRSFEEIFLAGTKYGIPPEIMTRLQWVWDQSRVVAGEVVEIGKLIVAEILKFLEQNRALAVGAAIGAAVGALVAMIPLIGPILAPLTASVGAFYGAGVAAAIRKGDNSGSPFTAALALAQKFFELFASIVNAVASRWSFESAAA